MGIFDYIKKKSNFGAKEVKLNYASMLNGMSPLFTQFGKDIYASDAVQAAVACIAHEMKKLDPQHVIKRESDIIPVDDGIQAVLDNPNQLMTTADFIEKIVYQLFSCSNAFILPTWDASGKLDGLYPLQPTQVDFLQDVSGAYFVKFRFANSYESTVRYEDVIHIRYNYSVNEFMGGDEHGMPNHKALLKTLELNNTMLEGVGKALKSSFAINGVVKYNTMLDQDKTQKALAEMTEAVRNNESGFLPLDLKAEFIPFNRQISMVDDKTLKFIDEKILRHFGVSLPILTGDYTKEQYEAFYQKTLEPLIKTISQAFTKALFSRHEYIGFGHRIVFYPKDLIFMNTNQKIEMIKELGYTGGLFENEKRVLLGMRPLKELEGVRKVSLNYVNADIADQYQLGLYAGDGSEGTVTPVVGESPVNGQESGKEQLLVGQMQCITEILKQYGAGLYSHKQAKTLLKVAVCLTDEEAEDLLDRKIEPDGGDVNE